MENGSPAMNRCQTTKDKPAIKDCWGNPWPAFVSQFLNTLKDQHLMRRMHFLDSPPLVKVVIKGRTYLSFASNDYLGLASDPRLKDAACRAVRLWGTGAGASRLISGNTGLYRNLEKELRRFKKAEAALVFPTGYATNMGVITSLAGPGDLILSDALNHASIVDACRLSRAEVHIYPHKDLKHVEQALYQRSPKKKTIVVTDGVFSMDGDLAPIPGLQRLCTQYGALLVVDDAHGTGVLGESGGGVLEYYRLHPGDIIQIGTFSKALGSLGGFMAGHQLFTSFFLNRARPFIYSTALPPSVLAASCEALRIARSASRERKTLADLGQYLRNGLQKLGISAPSNPTPILPVIIGQSKEAVNLSEHLWERGILAPSIRPPTVPDNQSRLRISLSASHTQEDIDYLLWVLELYFKKGAP
jgi:8-amino-7-oxononanoate synthase